jgi:hypothetical protein
VIWAKFPYYLQPFPAINAPWMDTDWWQGANHRPATTHLNLSAGFFLKLLSVFFSLLVDAFVKSYNPFKFFGIVKSQKFASIVIPAKQTVSQFAKDVIPDSPAQPGVIRNPISTDS